MFFAFCIAIIDIIAGVVLVYSGVSPRMAFSIVMGVVVAEIVSRCTFHLFFSDKADYLRAWHFKFKWDLLSLLDGEYWEDWKAERKLALYHGLVICAGFGTFCLLVRWLCNKANG